MGTGGLYHGVTDLLADGDFTKWGRRDLVTGSIMIQDAPDGVLSTTCKQNCIEIGLAFGIIRNIHRFSSDWRQLAMICGERGGVRTSSEALVWRSASVYVSSRGLPFETEYPGALAETV